MEMIGSLGLPRALVDYVVTSHPILIMALTQSSGRYDIHSKILRSERATAATLSPPLEEVVSIDSGDSTRFCDWLLAPIDLLLYVGGTEVMRLAVSFQCGGALSRRHF